MGSTDPDTAGHPSKQAQTSKTKIWGVTPVLLVVIFLTLSCLLPGPIRKYFSIGQWLSILLSELSAAVAGISLGRFLVGDQTEKRRKPPNGSFFDKRAKPLRDQVDELIRQVGGDAVAAEKVVKKKLQPEYAIGQGLISREEYNDFRNTYLAQSELSLGLIIPFLLIIFAVAIKQEDNWSWLWMLLLIVASSWASSCFLFFIAMERRQKYRIELGLLLLSRWDKQAAADKAAKEAAKEAKAKASDKTQEDAIRKIFQDELKGLHLEVKPLVVEVRKGPEESAEKK